jgi:phosphoenolpyruvate synthase/pyruvate phosphate dikinase
MQHGRGYCAWPSRVPGAVDATAAFAVRGPRTHVEIARFLMEIGIDSISVTPDSIQRTLEAIVDIEAGRSARKAS